MIEKIAYILLIFTIIDIIVAFYYLYRKGDAILYVSVPIFNLEVIF